MRKTLIGAAAAATVAVTGLAFAQERQSGPEEKPAAGQMEKAGQRATGHEGAAAQAQGQMGEERQGQTGKAGEAETGQRKGQGGQMQNREREGQDETQLKREGKSEAQSNPTQKEQTGQAGKHEQGASQAEPERNAKTGESGKATEGRTQGAQNREGEQRAGEANKTGSGQAAQTERGTQGAQGERKSDQAGATQQNREGASQAGQTAATRNREGAAQEGQPSTSTAGGTSAGGGAASVEAKGNAHLSNDKAARIADTLMTTASPAQTNLNINVDASQPLPGNVELMPLPPAVVSIVPEYRGYEYVVVHDEIVIVQPSTRKVVEVIHRGGGTHAMREGGGHGHRLTLSQSQQRLIRETVRREHFREEPVQEQLNFGVTVPRDVTLEPAPPTLVSEIPMIERYRLFVAGGDRIVLVDPDTREVVDVID